MMIVDRDIDDLEINEILEITKHKLNFEIEDEKFISLIHDVSSDLYSRDTPYMINKLSYGLVSASEKKLAIECLEMVMKSDGIKRGAEKNLIKELVSKWNL